MSVNFPFILLGILQLSPLQSIALAVCSVLAQCRIRVLKPFTIVQIVFNVANVVTATVLTFRAYIGLLDIHMGVGPALTCAAAVYFFTNTFPVFLVIAADQNKFSWAQWQHDYLWFLPFYLVGGGIAVAAHLTGLVFGWTTSMLIIPLVYTIYRTYSAQMRIIQDREKHAKDTEELHLRTIESLAMAIEAKDRGTHEHLMRVRVYVTAGSTADTSVGGEERLHGSCRECVGLRSGLKGRKDPRREAPLPEGGHGFGLRPTAHPISHRQSLAETRLHTIHFLDQPLQPIQLQCSIRTISLAHSRPPCIMVEL